MLERQKNEQKFSKFQTILEKNSQNVRKKRNLSKTHLISIAKALSIGVSNLLVMSSVNSPLQFSRKLCITDKAPARPSSVTCHVNASPRAFSDSSSFVDRGKALRHSSNILGSKPLTTGTPSVIIDPISNQPLCVRFKLSLEFWLAVLSSSSAVLKMIFPFVCGIPSGECLTLPTTAAKAPLYPEMASGDDLIFSIASKHRSISDANAPQAPSCCKSRRQTRMNQYRANRVNKVQ
jgi:hypothetical protein